MYKAVGIVIIGNEILNGSVKDENCHFLCDRFYSLGIKVRKISVIPDDVDEICEEVSKFSRLYDAVITTGGVGPTHDDVTYEGVAKVFRQPLYVNEEMCDYFRNYLTVTDINDTANNGGCRNNRNSSSSSSSNDNNNSLLRLVTIPIDSEVLFLNVPAEMQVGATVFPLVKIRNVFVFPGVPKFMRYLFLELEKTYFASAGGMFYNRTIYLNQEENIIAPILNKIVKAYKATVTFGSYPQYDTDSNFKTKLTIESSMMEQCLSAEFTLLTELPSSWIVRAVNTTEPLDYNRFCTFLKSKNSLVSTVHTSIEIIEKCFNEYDFNDMFLSFNGGKDCTVMLYLVCYVYRKLKEAGRNFGQLKALYCYHENTFDEEIEFVNESARRYQLNLIVIKSSIRQSLETFIKDNPNARVSFLGVRKSDPAGVNIKHFQMTDEGWPQVLRVFPLLEWTYDDIWNFLRVMNIPYCSLYNYGYTSIGTKDNTLPNPNLHCKSLLDGRVHYKPAYLLTKVSTERKGRRFLTNIDEKQQNTYV